ncbi:MAG: hypothetical protein MHM6MM_000630 [Cercozoa sp. M6MM]
MSKPEHLGILKNKRADEVPRLSDVTTDLQLAEENRERNRLVGRTVAEKGRSASESRSNRSASSTTRRRRLKWDEGNLAANEEVKAQYAHIRIDEPPTPYHAPAHSPDEMNDSDDFDLGPAQSSAELEAELNKRARRSSVSSASSDTPGTGIQPGHASALEGLVAESLRRRDHASDHSEQHVGFDVSEETRLQQHESDFKARRKLHYDEWKAVQRMRSEMKDEDDEDVDS